MSYLFEADTYPNHPRILFIGYAESSHTHSWIDLLEGSKFNLRLFALPSGVPPDTWEVRTYVTSYFSPSLNPETRVRLYPASRVKRFVNRQVARIRGANTIEERAAKWLGEIIRQWRPDIIHTLGLDAAGEFYFRVRQKYQLGGIGKWVLQTRGGSDLALSHLDPERNKEIAEVFRACDQLLCDNNLNFRIAREMGVREDQLSSIGTVPGTGGVDVDALAKAWDGAPSSRRLILWPKAYECPWSKALPVFEALQLCWDKIQPCEIHMLAMTPDVRMWYWSLPEQIRMQCRAEERIPRQRALELMTRARVMLAPSLVDGTPNSMFEAMAAGAFPLVSPLETIRPIVEHEQNVLFARNLYPHEIADALVRALSDDALVDSAAERNLALVRQLANRFEIRSRVVKFYTGLAGENGRAVA